MDTKNLCRRAAAEGAVLLENKGNVLPLAAGTKLAVFGRAQTFYYKSGTGSGGLVHIEKEPVLIESLYENADLTIDPALVELYADFVREHPFDDGGGKWAGEPWYQEEMPLTDDVVCTAAARNDAALVVFARTAGEDHDNADEAGSYRLTEAEEAVLATVTAHFDRVIVALNVGNMIDTSFMARYPISSLMYIWQGGMEGANAFADLLSGKAYPAGKLTDTAAWHIEDHPSHAHFGNTERNVYAEDVYVGYRYFETFSKNTVQYPFGFGLSYTTFETVSTATEQDGVVTVSATVTNTGAHAGKEIVQAYVCAPCGKLGTPARQLAAFAKTAELQPGESQTLSLTVTLAELAAYDDNGVTGHASCYVLEAGDYAVYVGADVRAASHVLTVSVNTLTVVKELSRIQPPTVDFDRMCAVDTDGTRMLAYSAVTSEDIDLFTRIAANRPDEIVYTGDRGLKLKDVYDKRCTLEEFVAQLSDGDLAALACGEGMNSPKATPGTGGALGGQTESLSNFGIPVCCVTDGPSGIRLDSGERATLIPNGTLLACTWDATLVEELYTAIGEELRRYHVDALLGPGINIHRHPLCGRNFEYFSEDPYLTGKLAAAVTRGVAKYGAFATIKHFCGNNQETNRYGSETVVSERALREIYLKPFEIAVTEGENVLIMTAYNPVNGYWTASSYDLTATVLRGEWGFDNFVMTDWWAKCNLHRGEDGNGALLQAMIRAQNDVYMVCADAQTKSQSILEGLSQGYITRSELQRCAMTICAWIVRSITFAEYLERGCVPKYPVVRSDADMQTIAAIGTPAAQAVYPVELRAGAASLTLSVKSDTDVLAQTPVTVRVGEAAIVTVSVCGTEGAFVELKRFIDIPEDSTCEITLTHADVITVGELVIKQ